MKKTVVELFAGVGGFRVGLNKVTSIDKNGKAIESDNFEFVWSNQWEPSTRIQPAYDCYIKRFGNYLNHTNINISKVSTKNIPNHNLLVGGFPCQDYSVARTKSGEEGIQGKKGVLWWEIIRILKDKRPPFVLLENVDRLLKTPAAQKGRDFGIMLKTLSELNYSVEWRVLNAADFGLPQRRRRIFIFAYHKNTVLYKTLKKENPILQLKETGFFARKFKVDDLSGIQSNKVFSTFKDIVDISDNFTFLFENSGVYQDGVLTTGKVKVIPEKTASLKDYLDTSDIPDSYYLSKSQIEKFNYLKGKKRLERKSSNGYRYLYTEGKMTFPDRLDLPGRTMLTSEGTLNRSTHVVRDPKTQKLRLITPNEAEKLNQFPVGWTDTGMSKSNRYFTMGNALVCGLVSMIGDTLTEVFDNEE